MIPAQAPYEGREPTRRKGSYSEELVKIEVDACKEGSTSRKHQQVDQKWTWPVLGLAPFWWTTSCASPLKRGPKICLLRETPERKQRVRVGGFCGQRRTCPPRGVSRLLPFPLAVSLFCGVATGTSATSLLSPADFEADAACHSHLPVASGTRVPSRHCHGLWRGR